MGQPPEELRPERAAAAGARCEGHERCLDAQPVPRLARADGSAMTEQALVKFVLHEARLLDEKRFDDWYELFADDGYYWVPAMPGQTDPHLQNSLAYEDKFLLKLRVERLKSPLAFSQ